MNCHGLAWWLRKGALVGCCMVCACGGAPPLPLDETPGTPTEDPGGDTTPSPQAGDDDAITATPDSGGDDDETAADPGDDDTEASPTPDAGTPTPPPPSEGDVFHLTALRLADSARGADLDADGTVDNRFGATLDALYDTLYPMAEANIDASSMSSDQKSRTLAEVVGFLDAFVSTEGWNASLAPMLEDDSAALLLDFAWSEPGVGTCGWYSAHLGSRGWVIDLDLGKLSGAIDEAGSGWFGPAPLSLPIQLETTLAAGVSFAYETTLGFAPALTGIEGYATAGLTAEVAAGALSADQLTLFAGDMVDGLNSLIPGTSADLSAEQKAQAQDAIIAYVDLDLDGNGVLEAYSIAFELDAEGVSLKQ